MTASEDQNQLVREPAPAQPQGAGEVVDLTYAGWEAIQAAAAESPWIPPQYFQNDWVSDVCSFLREPCTTPPASQQAAQAVPEVTDMQIKAAVYERTKLNPNQAADVELLHQITLAFRDLLRAAKGEQ